MRSTTMDVAVLAARSRAAGWRRWMGAAALAVAALAGSAALAPARDLTPEGAGDSVAGALDAGASGTDASRKIVSRLRGLARDFRAAGINRSTAGALGPGARFSSSTLKVDDAGRVHVVVTVTDTSPAMLQALAARGLDAETFNATFGLVQGWIAVDDLDALAAEPAVKKIRPPAYARPRTGPIESQGDSIHHCDQARALGFTGAGVTVGVVSVGVANLAQSQASGELGPVQVLSAGDPTDAEGTAIMEIIRDCAPNAQLLFAFDGGTEVGMANSMQALKDAGADIIVDDIGFLTEPFFEDGTVAQANRSIGQTVLRVTAGGNDARAHYQGTFTPGNFDNDPLLQGVRHNFSGGDSLLRAQVSGNSVATIVLQWANPFGAAVDDYDLAVRLPNGTLFRVSNDVQNGNDDPVEVVDVVCPPPSNLPCFFDIEITKFSPPGGNQPLDLFCFGSCVFTEFNVRAGSIYGHVTVPEVVTVGAAAAVSPSVIESFSSAGPSAIAFPSPQVRQKPDVTGVDCVSTSPPGFTTFCGTSAAAPHVAGAAALVMEAMGGPATVSAVASALKGTAIDRGPAGYDSDWGFGLVDAVAAVRAVLQVSVAAAVLPASRSIAVGASATAFATIVTAGNQTATGCSIAPTTGVPAVFHYQTTDPATNAVTGTLDTPVDITAGSAATFVITFQASGEFAPTDVHLAFACANTAAAPVISGVNTLLLSASNTPVPDVIALAATPTADGIANIPGPTGTGFFVVATANVGAGGPITVSATTIAANLGVTLAVCQTDAGSNCIAAPSPSVAVQIGAGQTPTFAVFITGSVSVPFDPAGNRVVLLFKDGAGTTRGATSVAVRTQ